MKNIALTLTLEETNMILQGLGQLPFMQVYKLIEKIHMQAHEQLSGNTSAMPFASKGKEEKNGDGH